MKDNMVFIVGLHRTGSTFLKNVLNNHPEICMLPEELHLWSPYPWRTDLSDICFLKDIRNAQGIEEVLNDIFKDKKLYGPFWRRLEEYNIEYEEVLEFLKTHPPKDCIDIPNSIFGIYKKKCNKRILGAKYPVHIGGVKLLEKWYPGSKIIHLTRDPRAIYISKSKDEASRERKKNHPILSFFYDLYTMLYIAYEYKLSTMLHNKYKKNENYMLLRYEDLLTEPDKILKEVCDFIGVKYVREMMYATGKPSSLDGKIKKGVDKKRAYRWRTVIKPWEKILIDILTSNSRKKLGYGED